MFSPSIPFPSAYPVAQAPYAPAGMAPFPPQAQMPPPQLIGYPFAPNPLYGLGPLPMQGPLPGVGLPPAQGQMFGQPLAPANVHPQLLPPAAQHARHELFRAKEEFRNGIDNAVELYGDRVQFEEVTNQQGRILGYLMAPISNNVPRAWAERPTLLVAASRGMAARPAIWTDVPVNFHNVPATPNGLLDLTLLLRRGKLARPVPRTAPGQAECLPDMRISSQALGPEDAARMLARRAKLLSPGRKVEIFVAAPGSNASLSDLQEELAWRKYGEIVCAG